MIQGILIPFRAPMLDGLPEGSGLYGLEWVQDRDAYQFWLQSPVPRSDLTSGCVFVITAWRLEGWDIARAELSERTFKDWIIPIMRTVRAIHQFKVMYAGWR